MAPSKQSLADMSLALYPHHNLSPELDGFILPARIHKTSGTVKNADTLLSGTRSFDVSAPCCTLVSSESEKATVVLDYGVVVGGVPLFHVKAVCPDKLSDSDLLRVRYTEAYAYIDREGGDGPFPFTAAADTLRENE